MHFCLYLCVPHAAASTSLRARRYAAIYLEQEGFASETRFGGVCDYFSVGGRWSGRLELLRLMAEKPSKFKQFWKQFQNVASNAQAQRLFKRMFPEFERAIPVGRADVSFLGEPDDAQLIDSILLKQLEQGVSETVDHSWKIENPNVLCSDLYEGDWSNEEILDKQWVVVIDYHC